MNPSNLLALVLIALSSPAVTADGDPRLKGEEAWRQAMALERDMAAAKNTEQLAAIGRSIDQLADRFAREARKDDPALHFILAKCDGLALRCLMKRAEKGDAEVGGEFLYRKIGESARRLASCPPRGEVERAGKKLGWPEAPWTERHDQLEEAVMAAEAALFELTTPMKSLAELVGYVQKYGRRVDAQLASPCPGAYRQLFLLYCLDGDPTTAREFELHFGRNRDVNGSWPLAWRSLQEGGTMRRFQSVCQKGSDLLAPGGEPDPAKLDAFITEMCQLAPTGLAFTAVQRLAKRALDEGRFDDALAIAEDYAPCFTGRGNLFREAEAGFNAFRDAVKMAKKEAAEFKSVRTEVRLNGLDANAAQPVHFDFSPNKSHLLIHPAANDGRADIFIGKAQNADLTAYARLATHERSNADQLVHFLTRPNRSIDNEHELLGFPQGGGWKVSSIYANHTIAEAFKRAGIIVEDLSIALYKANPRFDHIAFFVSTSTGADRPDTCWPAGLADARLQNYRDPKRHGGKEAGNANTDIFYSFKLSDGTGWTPPRRLPVEVNSRYSERTPYYLDGKLFFSSEGHGALGGFDVFYVNLSILDDEARPSGPTVNVARLNTTADDLCFRAVKLPGNRTLEFCSTNRGPDEHRFRIEQVQQIPRPSSPTPTPTTPTPTSKHRDSGLRGSGGKIPKLTYQCYRDEQSEPGKAYLKGKVYMVDERDSTLGILAGAEMVVEGEGEDARARKLTTDDDGNFRTEINPGEGYQLVVMKKDDRKNYYSFGMDRIKPCRDLNDNRIYHDVVAKTVEVQLKLPVPFFFNFNEADVNEELTNRDSIKFYLDQFFGKFWKGNDTSMLIIVAFADTVGDDERNALLSQRRAEDVMRFLHETYGIPFANMMRDGLGETTRFDAEYRDYINGSRPVYTFPKALTGPSSIGDPARLTKLQLNRRAEIILCGQSKGDIKRCMCRFDRLPPDPFKTLPDCGPD